MTDASSLHCPNCGAPAGPELRRCSFCRARLATVGCPSCFALMFDESAFCGRCGAPRRREAHDAPAPRCPGCREEMQAIAVGGTPLFECGTCDGVWMDAETFEAVCADREAQAAVLHRFPARPPKAAAVRYRPCARCGKMMNRVNFARVSGIVVDACKGHGTYLDPGELHALVEFIHSGGMERARARQLEELEERERRAAEAERRLARDRGRSDPHFSTGLASWSFLVGSGDADE